MQECCDGRRLRHSRYTLLYAALLLAPVCLTHADTPATPFEPDEHTLLLYHFDEGSGATAHDATAAAYHGEVRGAQWGDGKFGSALSFDGKDDSVFRHLTPALRGLKQLTVECWFSQTDPQGRQFLVGKDVMFHFDVTNGGATSLSIYHHGGREQNVEGLKHQHLGTATGSIRPGRWVHAATTYDGSHISFFLNGVLKKRLRAATAFSLGVESRGIWVGCYVGQDFWFNGCIDEVRVSDCVRYDPDKTLREGQPAFTLERGRNLRKDVRTAQRTGLASLRLQITKAYGTTASAWVYLKPPHSRAAIVGKVELRDLNDGDAKTVSFDVSDEVQAEGRYLVGLEPIDMGAYIEVTEAVLRRSAAEIATWSGRERSRRTFKPPLLIPLQTSGHVEPEEPLGRILLLPQAVDRFDGDIDLEREPKSGCSRLVGDGLAEYWLHTTAPAAGPYRLYLRYATPITRPCDVVLDGADLNDFNMCALNRTDSIRPEDALWEYQGTVTLEPGTHWLRMQDVLPDIYGIRLEPAQDVSARKTPWRAFAEPDRSFLLDTAAWHAVPLFGDPRDAAASVVGETTERVLAFSAAFSNTDRQQLEAGDCVRLVRRGEWNLAPFGRLRFGLRGSGSGHVMSLWLVDVKGDERLLWRCRDTTSDTQDITVEVSFEGNNVFDPTHVVAIALELDEGNRNAADPNRFSAAMLEPVFIRRDSTGHPDDHAARIAAARRALEAQRQGSVKSPVTLTAPPHTPCIEPVIPERHPLFQSTDPKPVTRETLGYALHFTGARNIGSETLDRFHKHYDFGDVCWPHIGMLPLRSRCKDDDAYQQSLDHLKERLHDVKARGLLLFDIWGYVPHTPQYPWKVAPEHHAILLNVLGDRFLGYDNGEQDGRYIGGYAHKTTATDRKDGWDEFVQWDEHICNDHMNYMNATGSLNFSHYYGERGARMLGLETAQGLPSDTLMFAFLRGAGKQYGRLIYQASSIWNRFGYNLYNDRRTVSTRSDGYGLGPNKGCSRSLHKRLLLCGYLGGHSIFGTETGQFTADVHPDGAAELSALGEQHLRLKKWAGEHPDRGVMLTPVAVMLDFYNGWNMPRHLYRRDTYRIWGKFPYAKGDYAIDALFRMIWPGYEDCSYLRNERGFVCPTPYGDIFDVINNRCLLPVLKRYAAIMLLGEVEMTPDAVTRLTRYVQEGGDLLIDAQRAAALPTSLTGFEIAETALQGCMSCRPGTGRQFEEMPYSYARLTLASARAALVNEYGHTLLSVNEAGAGRVIVCTVDNWLTDKLTYGTPDIVNMEPPYRLLDGLKSLLVTYFDSFNPVSIEPDGLTVRTCRFAEAPNRLLVGLINNDLFADWSGVLNLRTGKPVEARDIWSDTPLRPGKTIRLSIPAGDAAILDLRLE